MNWKQILLNLSSIAAGAYGVAITQAPAGVPISGKTIGTVVGGAVLANLIGLFQRQPHADPQ
jgi:hypothetical protein